jgi:hypothetical protein
MGSRGFPPSTNEMARYYSEEGDTRDLKEAFRFARMNVRDGTCEFESFNIWHSMKMDFSYK